MPYSLDDTIVAVCSPPGGAARGIIRLSGPDAPGILSRCLEIEGEPDLVTLRCAAVLRATLRLRAPLPCRLYFWPSGRSYTGDWVAEIHTLGCAPLLEAAVRRLCDRGARLAEPGEFTLRAFLAGRIDLTRAEAVLGVVDAVDAGQLQTALSQLAGGLAGPLTALRDQLLDLLGRLEAGLDFADEDLPFITAEELAAELAKAVEAVAGVAAQLAFRRETTDAVRAVLAGQPNTGKSSLFNRLIDAPGALVAESPGTTRDYLTAELELEGVRLRLIDTAGLETAGGMPGNDVGRAAQAHTVEQLGAAGVHVLCLDSTRPLSDFERAELARPIRAERIVVLTKVDTAQRTDFAGDSVRTSSLTGEGIDALRRRLRQAALAASGPATNAVAGTALRCGQSVRLARSCLDRARRLCSDGLGEELIAAEIRTALEELGKVVGAVHTEDVLDRIFSRFCIGK